MQMDRTVYMHPQEFIEPKYSSILCYKKKDIHNEKYSDDEHSSEYGWVGVKHQVLVLIEIYPAPHK